MPGPRTLLTIWNGLDVDVDFTVDGEPWGINFGGTVDYEIEPGRHVLVVTPEGQEAQTVELELNVADAVLEPASFEGLEPWPESFVWAVEITGGGIDLLSKSQCARMLAGDDDY